MSHNVPAVCGVLAKSGGGVKEGLKKGLLPGNS
jgi:hypothetical protein